MDTSKSGSTTVCGYKIDFDYLSSTPKHYLSLLLKYTVPKDFVWDQALKKIIECENNQNLCRNDVQQTRIKFAGSTSEGLAVPDFYYQHDMVIVRADIDKLFIQNNVFYFEVPFEDREYSSGQTLRIAHAPNAPPNYAYLTPTEAFKTARMLLGIPVTTIYFSNIICKEDRIKAWNYTDAGRRIHGTFNMTIHGPAVTLENNMAEFDEVPVIFFPGWPTVARNWAVRKRASGWPAKDVVNRTVTLGFYMAGVGRHGTEMCEYEWRYSFNKAEQILAHSLSNCQRQIYIYLKLFRKLFLSEPSVFPSYWLKTFFFWICEKVSAQEFQSENLGHMMLFLFDELIHIVSTAHLSNYFIPEINMLTMAPREHLASLLKNLRFVKNNMIECIIHIDSKITFVNMDRMNTHKLSVIFSDCLRAIKDHPRDTDQFISSATSGLKKLLGFYLYKIEQLDRFSEDFVLEKQFQRNNYIDLVLEVLVDLRKFCNCTDLGDDMDLVHVVGQNNNAITISKTLVLLGIQGNKAKTPDVKQRLCKIIDRRLANSKPSKCCLNSEHERDLLVDVRNAVVALPPKSVDNVDNKKLYRIKCVHDVPDIPMF